MIKYYIIQVRGRKDRTKIRYFTAPPSSRPGISSKFSLDIKDAYVYADVRVAVNEYAFSKSNDHYEYFLETIEVDVGPHIQRAKAL